MKKLLPHNLAIEKMILMACPYDYEFLQHVTNTLETNDFYDYIHRMIFNALKDLCLSKSRVNLSSLMKELTLTKNEEASQYCLDFYNEALDPEYFEEKVQELKNLGFHRNMILRCESGVAYFMEQKSASQEKCMEWVNELSDMIYKSKKTKAYRTVTEILDKFKEDPDMSFIEHLQKRQEQALKGLPIQLGLPTHFKDIDAIYDGFKPGHLIIIGARPGVGKTTFMCNLVLNMTRINRVPVAIMSLEMENKEIVEKLVLIDSGIDSKNYKDGKISPKEFQDINVSAREISTDGIFIDDTAGININLLYSRIKHLKNKYDTQVVFIDYLQLIKGSSKTSTKYEEITAISQTLKKIAKDLKICVVSLAQLNRDAAKSGKPMMSDLRDSGSIEQDADAIFLLHDPSVTEAHNNKTLEVNLAKNRFGSCGQIKLEFDKSLSKISNFNIDIKGVTAAWKDAF